MIHTKCKKIAVVENDNPQIFEALVNNKLEELCKFRPVLELNFNRPNLCGIIRYDYEEYTPENLAERFELQGIIYHCSDCPYAETYKKSNGEPDGRRGCHIYCGKYERDTLKHFNACDIYYRDFVLNKAKPTTANSADEIPDNAVEINRE